MIKVMPGDLSSLMGNDEHLFTGLLAFVSSLVKAIFKFWAKFLLVGSLLLNFRIDFYVFGIQVLQET